MKKREFLRGCEGEVFTSWIYRCAHSLRCKRVTFLDIEQYLASCYRLGEDPDFTLGRSFEAFCQNTGLNAASCQSFFTLKDTSIFISEEWRRSYCMYCLEEDVTRIGFPAWRKEWCSVFSSYCLRHKKMLCIEPFTDLNNKAWDAFSSTSRESHCLTARQNRLKFDMLALRVQGLANRYRSDDKRSCRYAVRFLMMSYLSLRTNWRDAGYAKILFNPSPWCRITRGEYSYDECMKLGASRSDPIQRTSALLLSGVVLGIFSKNELLFLQKCAGEHGYSFPATPIEAGFYIPHFHAYEERASYICKLSQESLSCSSRQRSRLALFCSKLRGHYDY